jgi:hypothetical protein
MSVPIRLLKLMTGPALSPDDRVAFDVLDVERRTRVKDDLQCPCHLISMLAFGCGRKAERLEERLPGVDISLANCEEQRVVIGAATDLVASLCPHADGIDPRECERPITELRYDVGLLDGGWTDAGARGDEFACRSPHALVDHVEAISIADVTPILESIDCLPNRLVWRVEALGDTTDGVPTFGSEDDLRGRVVENLVYLIISNKTVIIKYLTTVSGRGLSGSWRPSHDASIPTVCTAEPNRAHRPLDTRSGCC